MSREYLTAKLNKLIASKQFENVLKPILISLGKK